MAITYTTDWSDIANGTLLKNVSGWTTDGAFAADQDALKVSTAVVGAGALTGTDQIIGYCDLENASGTATVSSTNSTFQVNTTNGLFDV